MNEIGVNDVMELQQWSGVNDDATRALRQRRYRARRLGSHPTASVLPVTCWCEDTVLFASRRDILEGRTHSCGARDCKQPEAA